MGRAGRRRCFLLGAGGRSGCLELAAPLLLQVILYKDNRTVKSYGIFTRGYIAVIPTLVAVC